MSTTTQAASSNQIKAGRTQKRGSSKRRRATKVPTIAHKVVALALLTTVSFGFLGTSGASAQHDTYACNNLFRSGHGHYGCGGLQEMWYTGNYGWTLYYW